MQKVHRDREYMQIRQRLINYPTGIQTLLTALRLHVSMTCLYMVLDIGLILCSSDALESPPEGGIAVGRLSQSVQRQLVKLQDKTSNIRRDVCRSRDSEEV